MQLQLGDSLLGVGYSCIGFEPQNVEQGMSNDEVKPPESNCSKFEIPCSTFDIQKHARTVFLIPVRLSRLPEDLRPSAHLVRAATWSFCAVSCLDFGFAKTNWLVPVVRSSNPASQ